MRIARRQALAGLATLCASGKFAHAETELVTVRTGALPILLTAPHGGRLAVPNVRERSKTNPQTRERSRSYGGVVLGADLNTDLLAHAIASDLQRLTGRAPSLVIANFARRYIDANRPPEAAYDDEAAAPTYRAYHDSVRTQVNGLRAKHGRALLVDLHGQGVEANVLMRGTLNGASVSALTSRAGVESLTGSKGLFSLLKQQGFGTFPDQPVAKGLGGEDAGFRGGYTVATYGSHHPDGIDAVQWELGIDYRRKEALAVWSQKAAAALAEFAKNYL
jgi:N-formylglutamate amidohydrolase